MGGRITRVCKRSAWLKFAKGLCVGFEGETMEDFPEFMKCSANRIAASSQSTPGVEGYVFDGADGGQMAFWTCHQTAASPPHMHDYDEYMIVVHGCYTLIVGGKRIPVNVGAEAFIPK